MQISHDVKFKRVTIQFDDFDEEIGIITALNDIRTSVVNSSELGPSPDIDRALELILALIGVSNNLFMDSGS